MVDSSIHGSASSQEKVLNYFVRILAKRSPLSIRSDEGARRFIDRWCFYETRGRV